MRVLFAVGFSTALSLMLVGACGGSDEEEEIPDWLVEEPAPSPAENEASTFAVHEWGLIGHHYDAAVDAGFMLATGRGRGQRPPPPALPRHPPTPRGGGKRVHGEEGKPVIYVHLDEPGGDTPIHVTLDVGEGQMMEQLPAARREGSRYEWDLVATRGACRAAARYPDADSDACSGRHDGYCEAAELAAYESDDGACLVVDGERWNHLFYRTRVRVALPVQVRRDASGFQVRTTQALPGKLIRVRRGARLADTRVHVFDAPHEGAELPLADADTQAGVALQEIRSELTRLGMTPGESAAFQRAWVPDLLGSNTPLRNGVQDMRAPSDLQPKSDVLLYFLPESVVQEMAPLSFEPAAREVRRAILVRIDLGAAEEAQRLATPGQDPHLTWLNPRVVGAFNQESVGTQQRLHQAELLNCYEDALRQDPQSTGLAEIRYGIGGDGTTGDVDVRWLAGGNAGLGECLETRIRTWRFDQAPGGTARVRQPLLFEQR